jgi:hypothetical protein
MGYITKAGRFRGFSRINDGLDVVDWKGFSLREDERSVIAIWMLRASERARTRRTPAPEQSGGAQRAPL